MDRELGYRPFLDGLRAVAVYLVVLFHAGSDRFSGGFIGVDVFFVLSGFLVTQLLLRDLVGTGRVSFRRFYARRVRRLLPAAFVVLIVTVLVIGALVSPAELVAAEGGFRASFLYVANWHFIDQSSDYFGADLSSNPVLHFWSLAVEEQFYVVWPLLLAGLFALSSRVGAQRWRLLRVVVAAGALASLWWAWSLRSSDPNRAYYGTDARAYQLMAGAWLALTPGLATRLGRHPRWARPLGVVAAVGLLLVASSWVDLGAIERGTVTTVVTVVLLAAMEAAGGGPLHRLLATRPLVYLGKISYGTYLWHWPVIVVIAVSSDASPLPVIALTTLVATALASLSFELLEHPVRVSAVLDRYRTPVIAAGLVLSVTSALVVIPTLVDRSVAPVAASDASLAATGFPAVPPGTDWAAVRADRLPFHGCLDQPADDCTLVQGTGPHVLLIGDSHAAMLIPTFEAIARARDLTLSVSAQAGCPWQRNLYAPPLLGREDDCRRARADLYDRVIPALQPDLVVAMNLGYDQPGQRLVYFGPGGQALPNGDADTDAWLERVTKESLADLRSKAGGVAVLEPAPFDVSGADPLACLSEATTIAACRFVARVGSTSLEALYRDLARPAERVWSVDLDRLVCPYLPICDPILGREVVRLDSNHLTAGFAETLAPAVTTALTDIGALPG